MTKLPVGTLLHYKWTVLPNSRHWVGVVVSQFKIFWICETGEKTTTKYFDTREYDVLFEPQKLNKKL